MSWRATLCAAVLLIAAAGKVWGQTASEYEVKAAFLVNFAKYVEWPASVFSSPVSPVRLCILGQDPFGATLNELVDKSAGTMRSLAVERVPTAEAAGDCQIVYVDREYRWEIHRDLALLRDKPVLTVGESRDFIDAGGVVAFRVEEGRVRLTISLPASRQSQLKISSRLLGLAKVVE